MFFGRWVKLGHSSGDPWASIACSVGTLVMSRGLSGEQRRVLKDSWEGSVSVPGVPGELPGRAQGPWARSRGLLWMSPEATGAFPDPPRTLLGAAGTGLGVSGTPPGAPGALWGSLGMSFGVPRLSKEVLGGSSESHGGAHTYAYMCARAVGYRPPPP